MKAVVAAVNQEKSLVGAFYVITNYRVELRFKLLCAGGARHLGSDVVSTTCQYLQRGGREEGRSVVKTSQDLPCTIYNLATISLSRTPEQV